MRWQLLFSVKKSHLYTATDAPADYFNDFSSNYFKIKINCDKPQFKMLRSISKLNGRFNRVYYVTPTFYKRNELNQLYSNARITDTTAFFSLNDFPDPLQGTHHVVYDRANNYGLLHSDPLKLDKAFKRIDIASTYENRLSLDEMAQKIAGETNLGSAQSLALNDLPKFLSVWSTLWTEFKIIWLPIMGDMRGKGRV